MTRRPRLRRLPASDAVGRADRMVELILACYGDPTPRSRPRRTAPVKLTDASAAVLARLDATGQTAQFADVANALHRHAIEVCTAAEPRCSVCPFVSFCRLGMERVRDDDRAVALDLFAGAGGMALGFGDAGFRVGLAVEMNRDAAQTYRANHRGVPVFETDVTTVTAGHVRAVIGRDPDVVTAGPPCQSYSAAGPRKQEDKRHTLFRHVVRLAAGTNAKAVVIENVPGISERKHGLKSYKQIIEEELARSFDVEVFLLTATDYGVPQLRRRYFFFGRRKGAAAFGAPPKTHSPDGTDARLEPTPTVMTTLAGLPKRVAGDLRDVHIDADGTVTRNVATMRHSQQVKDRIRAFRQSGELAPISYRRVARTHARTIIAGHRALPVHPRRDRTLSVREAACIQTFPRYYHFLGPRAEQPLQVANAVPPTLARAVGAHVLAKLNEQNTHGKDD